MKQNICRNILRIKTGKISRFHICFRLMLHAARVRSYRVALTLQARGFCGSQEKTFRRPFQKNHADFYNEEKLEKEMRRVFDVCHGCRACFNLCDSFPTLFDLVDKSPTQELDSVPATQFSVTFFVFGFYLLLTLSYAESCG